MLNDLIESIIEELTLTELNEIYLSQTGEVDLALKVIDSKQFWDFHTGLFTPVAGKAGKAHQERLGTELERCVLHLCEADKSLMERIEELLNEHIDHDEMRRDPDRWYGVAK